MLERAVQPFGLADGIGSVFLAVKNESGSVRIADIRCRGVAREDLGMFPGRAEIPFVTRRAVLRLEFGLLIIDTRTRNGCFESAGLGNRSLELFEWLEYGLL